MTHKSILLTSDTSKILLDEWHISVYPNQIPYSVAPDLGLHSYLRPV